MQCFILPTYPQGWGLHQSSARNPLYRYGFLSPHRCAGHVHHAHLTNSRFYHGCGNFLLDCNTAGRYYPFGYRVFGLRSPWRGSQPDPDLRQSSRLDLLHEIPSTEIIRRSELFWHHQNSFGHEGLAVMPCRARPHQML